MSPKVRAHTLRCAFGVLLGFCIPLLLAGVTNGRTSGSLRATAALSSSQKISVRSIQDLAQREAVILEALGWTKSESQESHMLARNPNAQHHVEAAESMLGDKEISLEFAGEEEIDARLAKNNALIAELSREYDLLARRAGDISKW